MMQQSMEIRQAYTRYFCNVLNNAIKYTPAQGEIRVVTRRELNQVIVCVEDDGIGMTADEYDSRF